MNNAPFRVHIYPVGSLLVVFGGLMIVLFGSMLRIDSSGAAVSHQHVWSDWGLHISMINSFATKSPADWFVHHPIFAGGKFTYPFVTNLISAFLVRLGWNLTQAILLPSIVYSLVFIVGLYTWAYVLSRRRSVAVLSVVLAFLSSGLGFMRLFIDTPLSLWITEIANPSDFYTAMNHYDWYSGNLVSGFLLPQRAFLLGAAFGLWIQVLVVFALRRRRLDKLCGVLLVGAGVLAGLLPIIHMHTFIVLVLVCAVLLTTREYWPRLAVFAVPAGILSTVLYFKFVHGGIQNMSFFSWNPGFSAKGGLLSWFKMWWWLWGPALPVALWSILVQRDQLVRSVSLGYIGVFVLANMVLFQPVPWDNSKLFIWVYIALCVIMAQVLVSRWRKTWQSKVLVLTLVLSLCSSGVLDIVKLLQNPVYGFELNSDDDIQLGIDIRENTKPNAIFATAAVIHHPVLAWGARPVLMYYWAWAWNFGFDHEQREQDLRVIFAGGEEAQEKLKEHAVSYVAIGPAELNDYSANREYFQDNFPAAFQNNNYTIFDVRSLTQTD